MHYKRVNLFPALFLLIAFSCTRYGEKALSGIESIAISNPDSALTVIRSFPEQVLITSGGKAHYALLYSQLLNANGIKVSSDSIIAPAVTYYSKHGSAEDRLKMYRLRSSIAENAGDDEAAMQWLVEGERYAGRSRDLSSSGGLYSAKGRIYRKVYDYDRSLRNYDIALSYYIQAGNIQREVSALIDKVYVNILTKSFDDAKVLLDDIESRWDTMDSRARSRWYEASITLSRLTGDDAVDSLIGQCKEEFGDPKDVPWLKIVDFYIAEGDITAAEKAIADYESCHKDYSISSAYQLRRSKLEELKDSPADALASYKTYMSILEQSNYDIIQNDTGYIEERSAFNIRHMKDRTNMVTVLAILVATLCLLLVFVKWISDLKAKHSLALKSIEEIKAEKDALANMLSNGSFLDKETVNLVGERLGLLNEFLTGEVTNNIIVKDSAQRKIDQLLSKKEGFVSSLALMFAVSHPDFISYLKNQSLSDKEIGLCCMLACGLKGQDIDKVMPVKTSYNMSSTIRRKLGLKTSDTNLGLYLAEKVRSM